MHQPDASGQRYASGRVTISDVATRAGVDRSVVSRVISEDARLNIRPETRQRVLAAIEELRYRPNAAARSLRTARTGTLGLFIPDFTNPVYAEIIKGAEAAAAERGYVLVTGSSAAPDLGPRRYLDLLGQGRVDGLLLAGSETRSTFVDHLEGQGLPWLLLNRRTERAGRYLILDDERAATLAVQHLVQLGHTRIAHIAGPTHADTAQRRRAGYVSAMSAAGLTIDDGLVVHADYTPAGGAAAMASLLNDDQWPTATFVANVASAIGALEALRTRGVAIPERMSVVAVHDLNLAGYLSPPLTTVRMPLDQLGRRGVELLTTAGADQFIEEVLAGPVELIPRASTGPPSS